MLLFLNTLFSTFLAMGYLLSLSYFKLDCGPLFRLKLQYSDVYSSESEDEQPPKKIDYQINHYVVVKFLVKKTAKYFVGMIISRSDDEYTVKFLKKSGENKFIFPQIDDVSVVDATDICSVLNQPVINHRHQYIFSDLDIVKFNLC